MAVEQNGTIGKGSIFGALEYRIGQTSVAETNDAQPPGTNTLPLLNGSVLVTHLTMVTINNGIL